MMRVVTGRVHEQNNDVAIARLHPHPQEQLNFQDIRNLPEDFLHVHMGIPTLSIQPCPHGQAYVRLSHLFHRDQLVQSGPHHFGNGHISFIPPNRAWNNRTVVFTHEVWLMLIGLNLDLWNDHLVDKAISQFGKLIVWEKDHNRMATILVKSRVSSLDTIPWFFNFTEGADPESDCWTAQCEVLLTRMLGAQPQDEDFPPDDPDDVNPNAFDFFGFGQPRQGPPNPPDGPLDNFGVNMANQQVVGWAPQPQQGNDLAQQQQIMQVVHGDNLGPQFIPPPVQQAFDQQDEAPPLIPLQQVPDEEIIINPEAHDAQLQQQDPQQLQEEQILAMDELTDSDSDAEVQPVVLPIPPVEIVPFLDFNNLQPLMPLELQLEDLMGFDDLDANGDNNVNQGPEHPHQNIHIGLVQIVQTPVDPIFGNLSPLGSLSALDTATETADWTKASFGPTPDAIRYWVKFFS